MADPRKFRYNSDFHSPAFVYKVEFDIDFTDTSATSVSFDIEHHLPFIPLLTGWWNPHTDEASSPYKYLDISSLLTIGWSKGTPTSSDYNLGIYGITDLYADSTKIHVELFKTRYFSSVAGLRLRPHFEITGFAPASYTGDITPLEDISPFRYSSDIKTSMIVAEDKVSVPARGSVEYYHNLGYIPFVRYWNIVDGKWSPLQDSRDIWSGGTKTHLGIKSDTEKLTISNPLALNQEWYFQIFAGAKNET